MARIAYVNGSYVRHVEACVHVEDRGFQFADAIYEIWSVRAGALLDSARHFDRLERSLREISIAAPMSRTALGHVLHEVVRRNRVRDGLLYVQVTRGSAPRDHAFPAGPVRSTLVVTARSVDMAAMEERTRTGVGVRTCPETRWARCDIKSTGLLPNVLAKQAAREAGAFEAWFVDADGLVTEGSSTNAWIVTAKGELQTRSLDANILSGVTRLAILEIAAQRGMAVKERGFTVEEAKAAREAFFTAASAIVTPVVAIDDATIADGTPGPVAEALREAYLRKYA